MLYPIPSSVVTPKCLTLQLAAGLGKIRDVPEKRLAEIGVKQRRATTRGMREEADTRYAESALIWIACYGVRFKCDKVTKNFAVQGEMHGKFLGAWQEMPHFALWCRVRGSTPRVPAMRDFAQCF